MLCHECAREDGQEPAVAACRFCLIGLCKCHLVATFATVLGAQYACDHHPERPFPRASRAEQRPLVANVR